MRIDTTSSAPVVVIVRQATPPAVMHFTTYGPANVNDRTMVVEWHGSPGDAADAAIAAARATPVFPQR